MRQFPIDSQTREIWKKYPLRIYGLKISSCCGLPTVLVQSMEGGYVTRNCPKCGTKDTVPEEVFQQLSLWVACPECKMPMKAGKVSKNSRGEAKTYGYICEACQIEIRLADLLPRWTDTV